MKITISLINEKCINIMGPNWMVTKHPYSKGFVLQPEELQNYGFQTLDYKNFDTLKEVDNFLDGVAWQQNIIIKTERLNQEIQTYNKTYAKKLPLRELN